MGAFRSEAATFARRIVCTETYFSRLKVRAENGELAPAVENTLLHYAFGKPVEHVSVLTNNEADISALSIDQLASRAEQLHSMLMHRVAEDAKLEAEARAREEAQREQRDQEIASQAAAQDLMEHSVFHKIDTVN